MGKIILRLKISRTWYTFFYVSLLTRNLIKEEGGG